MKPFVTFPDADELLVTYLKARWDPRSEAFKPTGIRTKFPSESLTGNDFRIQVDLEVAGSRDYPIVERPQMRFTAWAPAGRATDVKDLASLTQAMVYTYPAGGRILIGRSKAITDPATKNLMCWFLAELTVPASPLAS